MKQFRRSSSVDILAFGAHPDDVELACGAALAAAERQGQSFGIIDLTRGEMGTRGTPEVRESEATEAAETLGATFRETLDLGDGAVRDSRENQLVVIEQLRQWKPKIILAPYPDDRHPDHTFTGRLITDAWFYAGLARLETALPKHRPQAVLYYLQNYMQPPTIVTDVSHVWEVKMRSIRAYSSQFYDPGSTEPQTFIAKKSFLDMIEARGRHFGAMIGVDFGEAFVARQPPKVQDLVAAFEGREV
jgi:N-acetylglucosamine malate deacetylase 1